MTYQRAYDNIVWYITQFCLTHVLPPTNKRLGSIRGFHYDSYETLQKGDLCILTSTRGPTDWSICWFEGMPSEEIYTMKSARTGQLCDWSNVGVEFMERDCVADHPEWRWDDKQWTFQDRWNKVCYKTNDAYITLPHRPVFSSDGSVTLGLRKRFSLDPDFHPEKTWPDYRKVTMKDMDAFYKEHAV